MVTVVVVMVIVVAEKDGGYSGGVRGWEHVREGLWNIGFDEVTAIM